MRESLDVIGVIKAHANALNVIRQSGLQGQDIVCIQSHRGVFLVLQVWQEQVEALYAKTAKTTVADYKKKTTRQKYAKEEAYVAFKSSIWVRGFLCRGSTFEPRKLKRFGVGV